MTTGFVLIAMLGIGVIVVAAIIALVVLLTKGKGSALQTARSVSTSGWTHWLLYLGMALVLALWSFWISLLFLSVVWILNLNPSAGSSYEITDQEMKTAGQIYTWLFWSPVITVPTFILAYGDASNQINDVVFAALRPLGLHILLLLGLTSKSAFVYRHTQQGILLIALRAGMAALFASLDEDYLLILFLLGNGSLWLFGTIWARNQIIRSECWLMNRKGETPSISTSTISPQPAHIHIEKSREFIRQFKKNEARNHALAAFRTGDRENRKQALQILETLDEVEQF